MSVIQQIIKCPVCDRAIATDSLPCDICQGIVSLEIAKNSNQLATFIDFHPNRQSQNLQPESEKQKDFITQLFDNSFLPWFYEKILPAFWIIGLRGWGGIEKEALEVSKFFGQDPKIVMDLSCGTGIMARKLVKNRFYQLIIALDYSEAMLKMLIEQLDPETIASTFENLAIVRGDAESVPLISNSVDAIYAGAAMHCWSNPQKGVAEIYRVLRPGGKIFATTFNNFLPSQEFHFFSIEELWSIFQNVGFKKESLEIESEGIYLTVKGNK